MRNIFIVIILLFCPCISLFAQDRYEEFKKEMSLIEKQENEYRKVIWGKNDFTQEYKDSVYKKHQVLVKEKVEFAKTALRNNRDDERFLKVLDIYVRNFLSLDEFEAELKLFSPRVQQTEACQRNFEFIKYARMNVPGQKCIDFEIKGHDGKTIKLSDVYKKHKLVLIDFWASWCGACRATMPSIKKIYTAYHEKGLEVVSISLDDNEKAGAKAYEEEKIPWIDGSNLLGWKDPVALWYAIRGIPHKVLIDRNGIIINSGFHQLGSLEQEIDKYLHSHKTKHLTFYTKLLPPTTF